VECLLRQVVLEILSEVVSDVYFIQSWLAAHAVTLCYFTEDLIEIQAVALLNDSEEWTEDVYSLSASVMDGVSTVCAWM